MLFRSFFIIQQMRTISRHFTTFCIFLMYRTLWWPTNYVLHNLVMVMQK